jgi:hypothetical protein
MLGFYELNKYVTSLQKFCELERQIGIRCAKRNTCAPPIQTSRSPAQVGALETKKSIISTAISLKQFLSDEL